MSTHNRITTLAAGVLLCGLSSQVALAASPDLSAAFTTRPNGFLTKSERRMPSTVSSDSGGLVDNLCARSARDSAACPPSLKDGAVDAAGELSAGLPHLRLDIVLKEMQNVVVSGTGVNSLGVFQEPWATFKIESTSADSSIPGQADAPYGLPVPAAGDTWSDIPHANGLFQGVIENGCLGPATFDLTLDSTIYRVSTSEVFGEVHLTDAVDGHGYYNFKYTIRATDESGNVSDFVFSGDANAYCSAQLGFESESAEELGLSAKTATVESTLASLQETDLFTQQDIDRSPGGYKLFVPGVGDVYVTQIRAPSAGKTCSIHKPSLIKAVAANPPTLNEPKWEELSIHYIFFPYRTVCLWPPGGGCYAMVKKTP
ncbi:MAG: hypothetical protein ABW034_07010 [Steroidobacteraceae bacterium]